MSGSTSSRTIDDIVRRGDALAAGVQDLEPDVEPVRLGPQVQPVADELGVRIGIEVIADRGRGADEGDAHRPRLARERHRGPAEAVRIGDQPDRRRGIGQEAVRRPLFAGWRIVDEEVARRVAEIGVLAGIADEIGVPCLEHVGAARAFGDAALLDLVDQLGPFRRHRLAVGQRRGVHGKPGALDAGRAGNLVEVARGRSGILGSIQPAHQELGRGGAKGHRNRDQEDVQQSFSHGCVTTRFVDSGPMRRKLSAVNVAK